MNRTFSILALASALLGAGMPAAQAAGIDGILMFRSVTFQQTGDTAPVNETGAFGIVQVEAANTGQFAQGVLGLPTSEFLPLWPLEEFLSQRRNFWVSTGLLADRAALNQAWSTGTYTVALSGFGEAVATFEYAADAYAAAVPHFSGGSLSAAQGLNPAQGFTFELSPFVGSDSNSWIFVNINQAFGSGDSVGDVVALPASTTSWTLPGGLLEPDRPYRLEIIYSRRSFQATVGANFDTLLAFDLRTTALIQTGPIPEPGTWALMALGLAAVGALSRRRAARA